MSHDSYIEALLARFANPALQHRTRQIAMDGSQKLPQRLLNTIRAQLDCDGPIACLSLVLSAWIRYCSARDDQGRPRKVDDPLSARFAQIAANAETPAETVDGFLAIREVFGADLPTSERFRNELVDGVTDLMRSDSAVACAEQRMARPRR